MNGLVPAIVVLIGKIAFLLALYGFLYAAYRGLLEEARRGSRSAWPPTAESATVDRWELRPASVAAPTIHPPAPPAAEKTATPDTAASVAPAAQPGEPPVEETVAGAGQPALFDAPQPPETPLHPSGPSAPASPAPPAVPEAAPAEPVAEEHPAALVVLNSPEASLPNGQRIAIGDGARLGRSERNDIVLKDRFVSADHAEVSRRGESYVLRDVGSTNGTFCNGARIEAEVVLRDGDRIGVGTSVFAFHEEQ